jgi:hypothetical protein
MSNPPPTDPFTALGEAMTTLGLAVMDAFERAMRRPLLFIGVVLAIGVIAGALAALVS